MTKLEFNQWWGDYSARFPETGEWVRRQPNAAALLGFWQEALAATALADALEVNRLLTRGELERWKSSGGYHEREETPAMVRKMAWDLGRGRGDRREHHERRDPDAPPSKFPIGILLRRLVAVNERCARDPSVDKEAEHERVKAEFLAEHSYQPAAPASAKRSAALDFYNERKDVF